VCQYFICFDPLRRLDKCGFKLKLIDSSLSGKMHGSGEIHKCYIYEKANQVFDNVRIKNNALEKLSTKWNDIPTPALDRYRPCVDHSAGYFKGVGLVGKSIERYRNWVWTEIGLDRAQRTLRKRKRIEYPE